MPRAKPFQTYRKTITRTSHHQNYIKTKGPSSDFALQYEGCESTVVSNQRAGWWGADLPPYWARLIAEAVRRSSLAGSGAAMEARRRHVRH